VFGKGTAEISYLAHNENGEATIVSKAQLPWHKTVDVPLGKDPIVSITLGEHGGQARCALAIHGKHLQSATAYGPFGRANCISELPAPDTSPSTSPAPLAP
jgi:hypothetical protein